MSFPFLARIKAHLLAPPPEGEARGVCWLGFLYPFEVYTLVLVGGAVLFLRWRGLRIDWQTVEYTLYPMVPMLPSALLGGIALQVLYRLVTRRSLREYLARVTTLGWLALWLRMWIAAMLMTYAYFWLKISVPLVHEHLWDRGLWNLDVLLHGGISPSVLITQGFRDAPVLPLLDTWYGLWVKTVFYAIAFFSAMPEALPRRRFMASAVLLWTLGSWLYLALPALGPIYAFPEVWNGLLDQMPRARASQASLWANYQTILAGRAGVLRRFNPTLGVAAFPSLHVAAHWLFALWARKGARLLFVSFVVATLLTLIGSVLTGWHYAVDGYAGLLLAWLCYRLGRLGEPARPAPQAPEPPEPAGAAPT
jgi:hypothetical protein